MSFTFEGQLKEGERGEQALDSVFEGPFLVHKFTRKTPFGRIMQNHGVDRAFECRNEKGRQCLVEYKTDKRAAETGNVFVEIVSVDTGKEPGWALKSWAGILVYYIPGHETVYLYNMLSIKRHVPYWKNRYNVCRAENDTYDTHGIPVPRTDERMQGCLIMEIPYSQIYRLDASRLLDYVPRTGDPK